MNIGLIGFGRTGKAVASVMLQHEDFNLKWALRRSRLLEKYPVDIIIPYFKD